jgi:hypothetical protein
MSTKFRLKHEQSTPDTMYPGKEFDKMKRLISAAARPVFGHTKHVNLDKEVLPTPSDTAIFAESLGQPIMEATTHSSLMKDFYKILSRCGKSET